MSVYLNRDVSWLKFNERVLNESMRKNHPLLERALFLKIVSTNLKEFSMVRIGSLNQLLSLDEKAIDWRSEKPLKKVIKSLNETMNEQRVKMIKSGEKLLKAFKQEGVHLMDFNALSDSDKELVLDHFMKDYFLLSHQMKVLLSDFLLSVESQKTYRMFQNKKGDFFQLSFISDPPYLIKRDDSTYLRTDDILNHLLMKEAASYFTISFYRNADIDYQDAFEDDEEMPKKLKKLLKKRQTTDLIRVHLKSAHLETILPYFEKNLSLSNDSIYATKDYESWEMLYQYFNQVIPTIDETFRFKFHQPTFPSSLNPKKSLIKQILKEDQLWHYPYDSFVTFEMLLYEGAMHQDVTSMAITIYRLAEQSHLVNVLKMARKNGKKVTVVLELRARFDEDNNMHYAAELEAAGCKVLYGPKKIKLHAKLFLMTFKDGQTITQIGSGNYHEVTARLYTDFAYLTTHSGIAKDGVSFFESLEKASKESPKYNHLLVAPTDLKNTLLDLIDQETKKGLDGYVGFKINALTDKEIMDALIKASQAGVKIQTIIRSIHCLKPGLKDYTKTISIQSIVGRFLEHSRLYIFGKTSKKVYVGSSDLMTRNLERRHEILAPVYDETIKKRLLDIFEYSLKDTLHSASIDEHGDHQVLWNETPSFNVQEVFLNQVKDGFNNL
jgi:polyphosphate kinase